MTELAGQRCDLRHDIVGGPHDLLRQLAIGFDLLIGIGETRSPFVELLRDQRIFNASHFHGHDLGWIPRAVERKRFQASPPATNRGVGDGPRGRAWRSMKRPGLP
jgi:hypothetical protein